MAGKPFFVEPMAFTASGGGAVSAAPVTHLSEYQFEGMVYRTSDITGTSALVTLDLGAAREFDYVAVLQSNAQATTTIRIQADSNADDLFGGGGATPEYDSGVLPFISPAVTGREFYHSHFELPAAQTKRYIGLIIADHAGPFEASFAVVGKKLASARYYDREWESGPDDLSVFGRGRNGVPDIAQGKTLRRVSFNLGWLTEAEYETGFGPMMQRLGRTGPVLLSFDPEATTLRQSRTYFGTMLDQSRFRMANFNRFEKQFELLSLI